MVSRFKKIKRKYLDIGAAYLFLAIEILITAVQPLGKLQTHWAQANTKTMKQFIEVYNANHKEQLRCKIIFIQWDYLEQTNISDKLVVPRPTEILRVTLLPYVPGSLSIYNVQNSWQI
jgi:hypothetical protein